MKKKMAQNIHLVTTIVAIMAILKKNIYGTFYSIIVAIMAILKQRIQLTPDDTIVAIVAIVEKKTNMNPGDNSCRNYGNSEKSW